MRSHALAAVATLAWALSLPAQEAGRARPATAPLSAAPRAESAPGIPPERLSEAMLLRLAYRVISSEDSTDVWEATASRAILPNADAQIRLTGEDIIIVIQLTPLVRDPAAPDFLLRILGQVFWKSENGRVSSYTSFSSLPMKFGEQATYYPLGTRSAGKDNVELILRLDRPGSAAAGE